MTDDHHGPIHHDIHHGVQVPLALSADERWVPALPFDDGHPLAHPLDLYRLHGPDNTDCQTGCADPEDCGDARYFARDTLATVTGWALLCGLLDTIAAHSVATPAPAPQAGRYGVTRVEVIHRPNLPIDRAVTTFPIGRYDTLLAAQTALQEAETSFSHQHSGMPASGHGIPQSPRLWIEQITPAWTRHIRFTLTMAESASHPGTHR